MKTYYFAYGSNKDIDQMISRYGKSNFKLISKKAYIENYSITFDKEYNGFSVANIRDSNEKVFGYLYEINRKALDALDYFEGKSWNGHYDRIVEKAFINTPSKTYSESKKEYFVQTYVYQGPSMKIKQISKEYFNKCKFNNDMKMMIKYGKYLI